MEKTSSPLVVDTFDNQFLTFGLLIQRIVYSTKSFRTIRDFTYLVIVKHFPIALELLWPINYIIQTTCRIICNSLKYRCYLIKFLITIISTPMDKLALQLSVKYANMYLMCKICYLSTGLEDSETGINGYVIAFKI